MASRIELPLRLVVLPGGRVHLSLRLPPASSGRAFLEWEVQQLVAHKPPGLMHAELLPDGPRMVLDADGEAVEGPPCGPPYQVLLRIQRPRSAVYWSEGGLVVRLLCGEGYPASPPEVRFEALLHHFFLDDLGGLPDLFYEVMQDLAEADAEERAASLSHLVGSLPGGEGGEGGVEAAGAASGEGLAVEHSHAAGSSGGVAGGARYSLRGTLHMLHFLLQAPLHPCDGCQQRFDYFASLHRDRAAAIAQYQPLRRHPFLFGTAARWRREWLSADARAALESRGGGGGLRSHLAEVSPEVFAFPLLREECCAMLVEEVDSYLASGLKAARPNSMNQYGLVLNEVGIEALFDSLLETVLQPIARACFPREGGSLDRHHSFVVQYAAGKDLSLGMHADDSEEAFSEASRSLPRRTSASTCTRTTAT